ncbi:hypothetical protein FIBSPDRAFT_799656 [Athelia psychrophila]|uniref:Uncharacterized protein n=1 Tax=Athelia psychrophila TaxID=1759441 RepID=A0A166AVI6_9AGAM|nr:hypothetical protein FIBSPDRAFT_799656 [Fibularhizoctonia sp. CBS 109695]
MSETAGSRAAHCRRTEGSACQIKPRLLDGSQLAPFVLFHHLLSAGPFAQMAIEPLLGTRAQRMFVGSIIVQGIVVLVMVGLVFGFVDEYVTFNTPRYKTLPCYLALFALAEVFELMMAFDALRLRNIIQLIGIMIFHAGLVVMAALQIHQTRDALLNPATCAADPKSYVQCSGSGTLINKVQPFLIVVPIVLAAAWVLIAFWIRELYSEFGWAIFHVVGANPKAKTQYQFYQVMICLLKFDFFAFTGVTMQLLIVVLNTHSAEFGVTIAAIPCVLLALAFCGYALQREIKWMMTVSLALMLAAMGYFLYKLVRFYQPYIDRPNPYQTVRATLTVFTIAAFLLLFATFAIGLRCFADFDKGLVEAKSHDVTNNNYLSGMPSPGRGNMSERQSSYMGGAPVQPRISIE